jgi:NIMA-interacting peptidyl-prolyl cis-trans isomerase 1
MMEEFEEAVGTLGEFEVSKVFESDSGVHLAVRTPLEYVPPADTATGAAALKGPYRAMQVLIKHQQSARMASWRDPNGDRIKNRPKAEAMASLSTMRAELQQLSGTLLAERFSEMARKESDCASAKEGGDLGRLEPEEMMEEFEEAVGALGEFEVSKVFESDSGVHLAVRTPLEYVPPAAPADAAATPAAAPAGATVLAGPDSYRGSHILIKHNLSARKASWRDPDGDEISIRPQKQAMTELVCHGCPMLRKGAE